MSRHRPWKASHASPLDEDEFDPLPPPPPPRPWWSLALQMYASKLVFADELEKAARESDDKDECSRLKKRAAYQRNLAKREIESAGEEVPPEFNPAYYLHRCHAEP